jgi:hypothetical protein
MNRCVRTSTFTRKVIKAAADALGKVIGKKSTTLKPVISPYSDEYFKLYNEKVVEFDTQFSLLLKKHIIS